MKLAEPSRSDNRTCNVIVNQDEEPPRVIRRRRFELGVIAVLVLLCTLAFVAMTHRSTKPIEFALEEAAPRPARASAPATFQEEVSRVVRNFVSHFDGSQPLKAGDRLTMGGKRAPKLRHVVAGPNQTVLLRRGNLLHALYLLGENGYVVISGNESKLVRLDDLRAMENDASATVTR